MFMVAWFIDVIFILPIMMQKLLAKKAAYNRMLFYAAGRIVVAMDWG
jgi:hypothetical protein